MRRAPTTTSVTMAALAAAVVAFGLPLGLGPARAGPPDPWPPEPWDDDEPASAKESQTAEKLYQDALYLETAFGDFLSAIQKYRRITREHRAVIEVAASAQLRIGSCYRELGRWDRAIEAYEQAIETFSSREDIVGEARRAVELCHAEQRADQRRARVDKIAQEARARDARTRIRVLQAIEKSGDSDLLPVVMERLDDADVRVRVAALRAIEKVGDNTIAERVYAMTTDPSAEVRQVALEVASALTERTPTRSPESLFLDLERGSAERRTHSIAMLQRIPAEDLVPLLIERLRDPSPKVRYYAVILLGNAGSADGVEPLKACLDDQYVSIRLNASRALFKLGDRSGRDVARDSLRHREKRIRYHAAWILSHFGDPACAEVLFEGLGDAGAFERGEAIAGLERLFGETLGFEAEGDEAERAAARAAWARKLGID